MWTLDRGSACDRSRLASPAAIVFWFLLPQLRLQMLSIPVWFGARSARMQFTNFQDRCTTSITGHGQYLFRVSSLVFTGPSCNVSDYEKCSILIIRIKSSLMFNAPADSCWPVSKTEYLQRFAPFRFFSLCGSWSLLFRNAEVLIQETINSDQFFKSESLILVTQRGFNDKGKDREQTWPYGGFR